MKVIDLTKQNAPIAPCYAQFIAAGQQLYVFHSTEEYETYKNANLSGRAIIIIRSVDGFMKFLKDTGDERNQNFFDKEIWLATGEKIVPDHWTPTGEMMYKMTEELTPVMTDNCYIRLISIMVLNANIICYTSSGIYRVSIFEWNISAAIKPNYYKLLGTGSIASADKEERKKKKMQRFLNRKIPMIADIRFIHYLINPTSVHYGNPESAAVAVYKGTTKNDRLAILETSRIKHLLFKELKNIMPGIVDDIQKKFPGTEVADYLDKMKNWALDKGNNKDQVEVLKLIVGMANYGSIVTDTAGNTRIEPIGASRKVEIIGEENSRKALPEPKSEVQSAVLVDKDKEKEFNLDAQYNES